MYSFLGRVILLVPPSYGLVCVERMKVRNPNPSRLRCKRSVDDTDTSTKYQHDDLPSQSYKFLSCETSFQVERVSFFSFHSISQHTLIPIWFDSNFCSFNFLLCNFSLKLELENNINRNNMAQIVICILEMKFVILWDSLMLSSLSCLKLSVLHQNL